MKRFVLAGLFLVLGFIILGVATSYVMNGPDKPEKPRHPTAANADETNKRHGSPGAAQQVNTDPLQPQNKPGQFGMPGGVGSTPGGMGGTAGSAGGTSGKMTGPRRDLTQVPGTIVPLTTAVQPPAIRPNPDANNTPHVPVLPQTDESSSSGRGHN
jgi:hypothetical protein